ncbi:MAG TPA: bifunctional demethylmenaquinone methyltransferase/2-methoxy-6-polyprenyl-1,4-benzoquinol methylase UbiE [Chitinophagaceae bacterium]|nr:bifunctional demethylmenaquinone methyltransferase/2-methoxy-6-polyprenyl-1,4-benzoquinol methylase UbiE [Chitinophagaceae bacterium]
MTKSLPHDSLKPFTDSGKTKKQQVAEMFDDLANRYDLMNRMLSCGIDISWRKKAISQLKNDDPKVILDVATGTGDMAIIACHMLKPEKIIGIDISEHMLDLGRKKVEKEGFNDVIQLQTDDSETINFADNSFDAVMVAFGVRNFEHLEIGLKEMFRVLKPGGRLIVLEFSRPRARFFRSLYNLYMSAVAPEVARWFSQNKKAYQYLNQSAKLFPDRRDFVEILNKTGYSDTSFKSLSAGICCIYTGRKLVSSK